MRYPGPRWAAEWPKLWALGPKHSGPNVLLSHIPGFVQTPDAWLPPHMVHGDTSGGDGGRAETGVVSAGGEEGGAAGGSEADFVRRVRELEGSVLSGFQLCSGAGPLCEEPLEGVAVCVESIRFLGDEAEVAASTDVYGPWSGQVIGAVKEGTRRAFLAGPRRLVEAVFDCEVQTSSDMLGKAYGVLNKRRATILDERLKEGTDIFIIEAKLPVVESFGMVSELRKQTSGAAQCQLVMAGWELIPNDPFWNPSTEEELEDGNSPEFQCNPEDGKSCISPGGVEEQCRNEISNTQESPSFLFKALLPSPPALPLSPFPLLRRTSSH